MKILNEFNLKSQISNLKSQISNLKSQISNLKSQIFEKTKFLLFIFLNLSIFLSAQNSDFITIIDESDFIIDAQSTAMYDSAKNNTMYSNVYPTEIGNVADFQVNGELTFNLPNNTTTFVAKASSIKSYPNGDYTWYGELIGEEHGTVLIVENDGRLDGRIGVDDDVYLIQSLSQGKSILLDVDESNFTGNECYIPSNTSNNSGGNSEETQNEPSLSLEIRGQCEDLPVRVLFLYTAAAANVCAPNATANMVIAQLNQVVENSGIDKQEDLRFAKAGVAALSSFTESGSPTTDIDLINLPSTSPVHIDATDLREQYSADIVVVFTDGNYTITIGGGTGTIHGIVQAGVVASGVTLGGPDLPFTIVEIDAAISKYTAVHEIGHLLGARHQRCSLYGVTCDNEPGDAHGSGWGERKCWLCKWKNYSTVMHALRDGNTRLPNFSNPDVDHNGYPTGNLGLRDNANVFEINGCAVAQYRDFTPPLSAYITGVNYVDNPGPFTWTAQVQNGTSPFLYQWSYSTDGFNYTVNTSQTGSTLTMLMPSGDYEDLYLRLSVADATGEIVTTFYQVDYASDCDPCFGGGSSNEFQSNPSTSIEEGKTLQIYPNPASDFIQVTFDVKKGEEGNVSVALLDLSGNIIQDIPQGYLKEGSYFMNMSLKNTASELHIIKIQKGNKVETKKLFITH